MNHHHRIVSLSNASLKEYPSNTLTKFIHRLPTVIDLQKPHSIAIKAIVLSHKLKERDDGSVYTVGYIKIHLKELSPHINSTNVDSRCLARIPYPSQIAEDATTFTYEFENPIHHPLLHTNKLTELSFHITDQKNNQLELDGGISTLIVLNIEEMEFQEQFSITVNPFDSIASFPSNSHSSFRVAFPNPITLNGKWEAAIHSIIVPRKLMMDTTHIMLIDRTTNTLMDEYHVKDTNYNWMREKFAEWKLKLEIIGQKVAVTRMAGNKDDVYLSYNPRAAVYLSIKPHEVGYRNLIIRKKGKSYFGRIVIGNNRPRNEHILLYSDIVDYSIVGNVTTRCLEIFGTNEAGLFQNKSSTLYPVKHLIFHPVCKNVFTSIDFKLAGLDGSTPSFYPAQLKQEGMSFHIIFRKKNDEHSRTTDEEMNDEKKT